MTNANSNADGYDQSDIYDLMWEEGKYHAELAKQVAMASFIQNFGQDARELTEFQSACLYQHLLIQRYQAESWDRIYKLALIALIASFPAWLIGINIWRGHEADMATHSQKMQQLYLQEKQLNADRCEFLKQWPVKPNPHIPAALGWLDRDYREYAKDLDKTCSLAKS